MIFKEVTTGIYPWDMHDEGIEMILDNLQSLVGCNAAYLIGLMHHEKRPLHANYYPHNPVRKKYYAEDSRCYWEIHPEMYAQSRIKPLESDRDFLRGTDWLELFVKALRKRGMKVGVEISHTPLDSVRGAGEFSDCIQRDIYGCPPPFGYHGNQQMCWNSPDARSYVCALASDLAKHYDVDMIQTCSFLFNPGQLDLHSFLGIALGGCFCKNCERAGRAYGLDWDLIKKTVKGLADMLKRSSLESNEEWLLLQRGSAKPTAFLIEHPELFQWMQFRCHTVTQYFKELSQAIHSENSRIDFRFNSCWPDGEFFGQDLTQLKKHVNSVRIMDYAEQTGDEAKVMNKGVWLSDVRRQVGYDMPIIDCIAPRAKATPDLIKKGIKVIALNGADGLGFGFYDGANIENLKAIKEGLIEAEVEIAG